MECGSVGGGVDRGAVESVKGERVESVERRFTLPTSTGGVQERADDAAAAAAVAVHASAASAACARAGLK